MERKSWLILCLTLLILSVLFPTLLFNFKTSTCLYFRFPPNEEASITGVVEDIAVEDVVDSLALPRFAYLISGSSGDGMQIQRTLQAVYHPQNYYILHLDLKAPPLERANLSDYILNDPIFLKYGNVLTVEEANQVTYRGPTMVTETLHGAAILLHRFKDWDWFINLSASDYPLVTQDDLLQAFSNVPRGVNFIEHTSRLGWKFDARAKSVFIDPALYLDVQHGNIMETRYHRQIPTKFKLFTGSAWMVLSRSFVEYTIIGWDNLPRTLLMYYANFISSPEGYFHTLICNSGEFQNTTVNHDMHYIAWDSPPQQHPMMLRVAHFDKMVHSNAPFAWKFAENDPVLTLIEEQLLGRSLGNFTLDGWCVGGEANPCNVTRKSSLLRPGVGVQRLQTLLEPLLQEPQFCSQQCT